MIQQASEECEEIQCLIKTVKYGWPQDKKAVPHLVN